MKKHLFLLLAAVATILAGCKSDVDLHNIDTRMAVEGGLALPVGSMTFTVGDFLGNGQVDHFYIKPYDNSSDSGIIYYLDTFSVADKEFHNLNIVDKLIEASDYEVPVVIPIPAGELKTITLPVELDLKNINNNRDERVDSLQLTSALVRTVLSKQGLADLQWSDFVEANIILDDPNIRMWNGQNKYALDLAGHNFGDTIDIQLQEASLNLMKDKAHPSAPNNTIDHLTVTLELKVRPQTTITPATGDMLIIGQRLAMLRYQAAWGFFEGGSDVRASGSEAMIDLWEGWKDIANARLHLAKPRLTIEAHHRIAAPLLLVIDTIAAYEVETGETRFATWDGQSKTQRQIMQSLSPYSLLTDSAFQTETFNENPSKGAIDRLFEIRPDSIFYSFRLMIDKSQRPFDFPYEQHRMTEDREFHAKAIVEVPFLFNAGAEMAYRDTVDSVNISQYSLDSLLADQKWIDTLKTTDVRLMLTAENGLPFRVNGQVIFEDKEGNPLDIWLTENNILTFPAPTNIVDERVVSGSKTFYTLAVDKKMANLLTQVHRIRYDVSLDGNVKKVAVTDKSRLKVNIGVSANVDAVLNLKN